MDFIAEVCMAVCGELWIFWGIDFNKQFEETNIVLKSVPIVNGVFMLLYPIVKTMVS